ncbi:MAG: hypothetical protein A2V21_313080 [Deltaproteobacteria bacterium GWC2_55_46]|nr:MAG: hypothetical protein A2Z79_07265 [Deltaproteobacteria bacterium GWA2_55_82]OGQ64377.1 MAG: hypothetical protein A3I81_00175 [Deltaproteobacteria bacterium RIFCSPLOWO2_02_FULL_55_12]OIJ72566.1 MAG: hypothetical protein A2V21_313080 [Deltaproteobacteria bacterium GWC2_55_46]
MKELPKHAKQFQFDGKNYQIKVSKGDIDEYIIRAFIEDKPANGYSYHVDFTTRYDLEQQIGYDAVSHLIDQAESDVRNKIWEKYLRAIAENAKS